MTSRARARRLAAGALGLLLLAADPAAADLADDVEELAKAWKAGGTVRVLEPRLLTQGTLFPLALSPDEMDSRGDGCTTIAILGAPSTSFVVRFTPPENPPPGYHPDRPEASLGGAAQIVRCGRRRSRLHRVAIEMRSPRGVLQAVVATGAAPFGALQRTLVHREAGAFAAATQPGPRPGSPPVADRAHALETRYEREGAIEVHKKLVPANADGAAFITFDLEPGCHRVHALGISSTTGIGPGLDVNAELAWADDGRVASSDRSDSPDAMLLLCNGETRQGLLTIVGALPQVPLLVVYARWTLPRGLPERWGAEPRAAVASAMMQQQLRELPDEPFYESLGTYGTTYLPVSLEPDACYVAAAAPLRGEPQLLGIAARAGGAASRAHAEDPAGAALVAFCARGSPHGLLEVEAHGLSVAWLVALWQTGRVDLGLELDGR